ncbi:MAG: fluoride efflux transporter CrcB [Pseudonocardiaceae bacterium]
MTVVLWIGVVLIGGAGSVLRLVVDGAIASRTGRAFPYGTLVVNLSGSVLLGLITGLALSHDGTLLAGTAAVGSYTTFSTWMFETQRLGEDRQMLSLTANVVVSLFAGVGAAALGQLLGGHLLGSHL